MKLKALPSSTDTTVKYSLVDGDESAILVISQDDSPAYTNPVITVNLPKSFTGSQAIEMFLRIMNIQDNKLSAMLSRIGKKPKR